MRYERLTDLFRLAVRLQGAGGLTIDEIREQFAVSHRTAERMHRAVADVFGPLERVDYHPDLRGSFSIKSVLPALVSGLGYDDLAIADGQVAAAMYRTALASADVAERQRTVGALRAYCERDTLAMVELCRALASLDSRR